MELYEAINKRRTIRVFTGPASEEALRKIIVAGTRAISAGNCQPWEFIIVDDPAIKEQIGEQKYQMNLAFSAEPEAREQKEAYFKSSAVAVCHKEGHGQLISAWMCIQNMALAATAEGLGTIPSTFGGDHQKVVEKLLGLPEDIKLGTVMLIGVQEGYPGPFADIERRPDFSWLYRNKYGTAA